MNIKAWLKRGQHEQGKEHRVRLGLFIRALAIVTGANGTDLAASTGMPWHSTNWNRLWRGYAKQEIQHAALVHLMATAREPVGAAEAADAMVRYWDAAGVPTRAAV